MNEYKVWLKVSLQKSYTGCVTITSDKDVDTLKANIQADAELKKQLIEKLLTEGKSTELTNEHVKIDLIYPSSPVSTESCHSSSFPILQSP